MMTSLPGAAPLAADLLAPALAWEVLLLALRAGLLAVTGWLVWRT